MANNEYKANNTIEFLRGGNEYFEKLKILIESAKQFIVIHTYIFADDQTGNMVVAYLKVAANRNVKVYLLIDGIASNSLSKKFINQLTEENITLRFFEPLFKSEKFYIGRRMHQKIIIIDGLVALVGGLNIADRYNDFPNQKAWLDFALKIEGEVVLDIFEKSKKYFKYIENKIKWPDKPINQNDQNSTCEARARINDWVWHKNEISNSYLEIFRNSKKEVIIFCSYFIPGKFIRRSIKNAINRGVKIKIITSEKSDIPITKQAEKWLYDWLLRNKVELYEFQPNILHGKIGVCDNIMFTIGSYNINNLSAYASIEMNIDVKNEPLCKIVLGKLNTIILNNCKQITKKYHRENKNHLIQFKRWLCYKTIRIVFLIFTFYFKRS
jgi:cardiolipin synthase